MDLSQELSQLREEFDGLSRDSQGLDSRTDKTLRNMKKIADESNRVADVAHNAPQILDDLDREFERQTKLNGLDITFMFLATAMQCVRWYVFPNIGIISSLIRGDRSNVSLMNRLYGAKDWRDMLASPVPYDAHIDIDGHLCKIKALANQPVMGWIFGPLNILTETVTTLDGLTPKSYAVRNMLVMEAVPIRDVFSYAISRIKSNAMNLPAAVVRHASHLGFNYFAAQGLPAPFIDTMRLWKNTDEDSYSKLLSLFHTSMYDITGDAAMSAFINAIVSYIHALFYDPSKYSSQRVYEVKTRKIVRYSNIIASTSNVIYTAISGDLLRLDVGGILVTLWRIIRDRKFQQEVKREFITESFNELIRGEEYEFE